ncbi:MAG: alpha/beta fold hydrolase [Anaerolineales bacterium]
MRTQSEKSMQSMHGHVPVNGLEMYYETYGGAGQPLVLLHGAFSAIGTSLGKILPALAKTRQVIAFELQAYGRTADIDRPMTLEGMADDVAAALRQLGMEQADIFGDTAAGLPNSQLAVLPGTSHVTLVDRVDWLVSMIDGFLDAPIKND